MGGSLTVRQARLVLPDRVVTGDLVVDQGVITEIAPRAAEAVGEEIDGRALVVLPGAIDPVVVLDTIEDLSAASMAAASGGVTSIVAVGPARTTTELKLELARAAELSRTHYALYLRAEVDNLSELRAERSRGAWIGGELLHDPRVDDVIAACERLVVVENVDPGRLAARASQLYATSTDPADHSRVQDVDGAVLATRRALELAHRHGRAMLISEISTAEELALLADRPPCVSAGVRPVHLFLDTADYDRLGTRAVATPALRGARHRQELLQALFAGGLDVVCSHHQEVRAEWKDHPYPTTPGGVPAAAATVPLLVDQIIEGRGTWLDLARVTSAAPARLLKLGRKGRLETGFDGDLMLIDPQEDRRVEASPGWSPWDGRTLRGSVAATVVKGAFVWREGQVYRTIRGRPL